MTNKAGDRLSTPNRYTGVFSHHFHIIFMLFFFFFLSTRPGCSPMERRLNCHSVVYYSYMEAWAFCPCCWATMLHCWCACCWCVYYVGFCVCRWGIVLLFFFNATKPANICLNCDLSRCREMTAEMRSVFLKWGKMSFSPLGRDFARGAASSSFQRQPYTK